MDSLQSTYSQRSLWWIPAAFVFLVIAVLFSEALHPVALPMSEEYWPLSWDSMTSLFVFTLFTYLFYNKCGGVRPAIGEPVSGRVVLFSILLGVVVLCSALVGYEAIYLPAKDIMPDWLANYIFFEFERITLDYPLWIVAVNLLNVALIAPIWEEMIFRGVLLFVLMKKLRFWPAAIISSVLFGVMHTDIIGATIFGIALCYLTWKTQSLWPAIIIHIINNFLATVLFYTVPSLFDSEPLLPMLVTMLLLIGSFKLIWWLSRKICRMHRIDTQSHAQRYQQLSE